MPCNTPCGSAVKSPLNAQRKVLDRHICLYGMDATLPSGGTVRGVLLADTDANRMIEMQGAINVRAPERYKFYSLERIPEGYHSLTVDGQAYHVVHCHTYYIGGTAAWYETTLVGGGLR